MTQTSQRPALLPPPPNMLALKVVQRVIVAQDVVSLFLQMPGKSGAPLPYLPGQFVSLAIPTPTEILYRSYSLCGDGAAQTPWEITVKKVLKGRVSSWLHDHIPVGATLYASQPRGSFVLPTPPRRDLPLIFIAAGSGITPIRGMIRALAKVGTRQRPLAQLHYGSTGVADIIYGSEWNLIDPQRTWLTQWHYLSDQHDQIAAEKVLQRAGPLLAHAHIYICGPDALRQELVAQLLRRGIPTDRIHYEVFATGARPSSVRIHRSAIASATGPQIFVQETAATVRAAPGESVLETLERSGYQPAYSCRDGSCGTCKLRLLAGRVDQQQAVALTTAEKNAGFILSCVAHPQSDIALLAGGRPPQRGSGAVTPAARATQRGIATMAVRAACVGAMSVGLLGVWNLTDHYPASWTNPTAGTNAGSGGDATPTIGNNPAPTRTPTRRATATPTDSSGGGPLPPTATPRPAPTATPQPTVVTRPSG